MSKSTRLAARRPAFTMIEALVVVSSVALLLTLLAPSLSRARAQARITTCQANIRQIGSLVAIYQAESSDFVPLVFSYWSNMAVMGPKPAEECWLSVALRRYDAQTRNLEARKFNPKICWPEPAEPGKPHLRDYERTIMPELYACPFERGRPAPAENPMREDKGEFWEYTFGGTWESYHTWTSSPRLLRWKSGPLAKYQQKYPTLHFNRDDRHRKWTARDAKTAGRGSLAEMTTVFCSQGEYMSTAFYPSISASCPPMRPFWANRGSHRQNDKGGTNALFADTHVEWVAGNQIGSP